MIDSAKAAAAARIYDWAQTWVSRKAPFDWLRANCCHLAADWVCHVEGVDPMDRLEPTRTARDAVRVVTRHGGLARAITHALQRDPISTHDAAIGDVIMIPPDAGRFGGGLVGSVGVVVGDLVMMRINDSVMLVHASSGSAAWRIRQ